MDAMLAALASENQRRSQPYLEQALELKARFVDATTPEEKRELRTIYEALEKPIRPWLHIHGIDALSVLSTLSDSMRQQGITHVVGPASVVEYALDRGFKAYNGTFDGNVAMHPEEFIELIASRSYVVKEGVLSLDPTAAVKDNMRVPAISAMPMANFVFFDADTRAEDVMGAYGALIRVVQTTDHRVILISAGEDLPEFVRGNVVSIWHEESYEPTVFILGQDGENRPRDLSKNMISSAVNDVIDQVRRLEPDQLSNMLLILPAESLVRRASVLIREAIAGRAQVLEFHSFNPSGLTPGRSNVMVTANQEIETWLFDKLDLVFDAGLINLRVINERGFSHNVYTPLDRRAFVRRSYLGGQYRTSTAGDDIPTRVLDEEHILSPTSWKVRNLIKIAPATYAVAAPELIALYTQSPPLYKISGLDIRPLQVLGLLAGSPGFGRIIAALQLRPSGSLKEALECDRKRPNLCKDKGVGILGSQIERDYRDLGGAAEAPFDEKYLRESLEQVYGPAVKGRIRLGDQGENFYYQI